MTQFLFVVDNPDRWPLDIPGVITVAARRYLADPEFSNLREARVLNLCRSYRYQSLGYYVSLLAEARGHRPLPRTNTIMDFKAVSLIKSISSDLDQLIQHSLKPLQGDSFVLSIYFARNLAHRYDRLSRALFNLFPAPLLRANFTRSNGTWSLQNISPIPSSEIPRTHREFVADAAKDYFSRRSAPRRRKMPRYYLGMLVRKDEKDDPTPPSDEKALQRFEKAAESLEVSVDRLTREDYGHLGEYDGLFIRQTTSVNSHTYRFARRAEAEGLVVIDDPESILRCTNKVFLQELLGRNHVPTPKSMVLHRDNFGDIVERMGLPVILKQPDSSFSQGVVKAETRDEFEEKAAALLGKSDLVIAQEFMPTEFDWRIGIIDRQPLYACRYFMAPSHWQIYNHSKKGRDNTGNFETVPIHRAPDHVVQIALKAANLIGNGLYGVDLKESKKRAYIIEVNDNPSIDSGVEDEVLGDQLYLTIMGTFLKRMERMREGRSS